MSEENVEIVIGQFESVNSRDFAAAMDAYAENVTLTLHGALATVIGGRAFAGKEAVGRWFGEWFRHFGPGYRFEIQETRDLGDRVFLHATHHGQGRHSGAPVEGENAYLYTVRNGKIAGVEIWDERDQALEAAGLPG